MSQKNFVELRNVTKRFGSNTVIDNINLTIPQGQMVTLLGPSGCGKTTILRLVAGLEKPSEGQIFIDGEDVTHRSIQQRDICMVFQSYALFPHMSLGENVGYGLKMLGVSRADVKTRVKEALAMVDLEGFEDRYVDQISGGQQQRVAIARSLVNEPEVLLLDEPLGALDLKLRKEMQLELKSMQQRLGITFIFVTHDQEEALTMSDTIVVMKDGTIQQIGDPKTIYDEPANAFVADFIGESNLLRGTMIHDELVEFAGTEFPCVDFGFGENTPVDVVVRPEDIMLVGEDVGQMVGTIKSVLFKGVHYEMMIDTGAYTFKVHSTTMQPQGSRVGLNIVPFNIHIMKRLEDTTPAAEVDAEC